MTKRRYSDDERAAALAALAGNEGNIGKTARDLGMPRGTLSRWADGSRHPEARQMAVEKKAALADRLEALAHDLVGDLATPANRKGATLRDIATALGITVDKMLLLRGEPTGSLELRFDLKRLNDEQLFKLESLVTAASERN